MSERVPNRPERSFRILQRQRSAFTLIELLVVISIIVLLMALLLPALARAKEAARRVACLSNIHQINIGLQGYMADSDGFLPPTQQGQNAGSTFQITNGLEYKVHQVQDGNSGRYWHGVGLLYAYDYVNDPNLVYCPSQRFDLFTYPIGWEGGWCTTSGTVLPCYDNFRFTGYYYRIFGQWAHSSTSSPGVTLNEVQRLQNYRGHPPIAVFADIFHPGGPSYWWGPPGFPADTLWPHRQGPAGLNVAFTDGHAEWISRPRMTEWGEVSLQVVGQSDRFAMMYWEWLEGSTDRLEEFYYLP